MSLMTVSSASADDLTIRQVLPLFGRELGVQHEIGHPDDAVHRRPNLVTHIGQELALGPVGGLGGVFGRSQVGLRLVAVRGVRHDAHDPDRIAVGVAIDPALRADPVQRRVGPADPTLQTEDACLVRHPRRPDAPRPASSGTTHAKRCFEPHSD